MIMVTTDDYDRLPRHQMSKGQATQMPTEFACSPYKDALGFRFFLHHISMFAIPFSRFFQIGCSSKIRLYCCSAVVAFRDPRAHFLKVSASVMDVGVDEPHGFHRRVSVR
jgi:hypothetical protein